MPAFELSLKTRRDLCGAGFQDVDAALRAAAVEMDLWCWFDSTHLSVASDGGFRHYTNFLAWADTTAVGINRGINRTGDQSLIERWRALDKESIRQEFRSRRNESLKDRRDVAPWQEIPAGEGKLLFRSFDGHFPGDVIGQSTDYLLWLRDEALPLLLEAIQLGSRGDTPICGDMTLEEQMAFPDTDPWTTRADPEFAVLINPDLVAHG